MPKDAQQPPDETTATIEQDAIRWCVVNLFANDDTALNIRLRSALRERLRPDLEGVAGIHFDAFISSIFRELSNLLNERLLPTPPGNRAKADSELVMRLRHIHERGTTYHRSTPANGHLSISDLKIVDGCRHCRTEWPCPSMRAVQPEEHQL